MLSDYKSEFDALFAEAALALSVDDYDKLIEYIKEEHMGGTP